MEERFLATGGGEEGDEGWAGEALAVIEDVAPYVEEMVLATRLPISSQGVFMNLTTKERERYTVEMTASGFRICAHGAYDTLDRAAAASHRSSEDDQSDAEAEGASIPAVEEYYETPYALLDAISPAYRKSFSDALTDRLNALPPPSPSK